MEYYLCINRDPQWKIIKDDSIKTIEEFLHEEYWSELPLFKLVYDIPAASKAVGDNFSYDHLDELYSAIKKKYSEQIVEIFNSSKTLLNTYNLSEFYYEFAQDEMSIENGLTISGMLFSQQLENFINKSEWQIALEANDGQLLSNLQNWPHPDINNESGLPEWKINGISYHPIIWFGIKGEKRLNNWTINGNGFNALVTVEDGLGSYGGQIRINGLEINHDLFYSECCWMYFGECGNEGADFHKVIDTCPIDIVSIVKGELEPQAALNSYFLSLQKGK